MSRLQEGAQRSLAYSLGAKKEYDRLEFELPESNEDLEFRARAPWTSAHAIRLLDKRQILSPVVVVTWCIWHNMAAGPA